jgi:hypothetical protein
MASPIQFYRNFQALMQRHGIRHVLTSGMACVEYGIQQNTKDTDLDFFGQPPRVRLEEIFTDRENHLAAPLIVAQMKKTDRDKDWPMVESLSWYAEDDWDALLHLRSVEKLQVRWGDCPTDLRAGLSRRRPLLRELDLGAVKPVKCLAIERMIWEQVNKQRYRRYQAEWKDFLRRWRAEPGHEWPVVMAFADQHILLGDAASRHRLPMNPLGGQAQRQSLIEHAWVAVAEVFDGEEQLIQRLSPPIAELLP